MPFTTGIAEQPVRPAVPGPGIRRLPPPPTMRYKRWKTKDWSSPSRAQGLCLVSIRGLW